jgi:hypothetical protein
MLIAEDEGGSDRHQAVCRSGSIRLTLQNDRHELRQIASRAAVFALLECDSDSFWPGNFISR